MTTKVKIKTNRNNKLKEEVLNIFRAMPYLLPFIILISFFVLWPIIYVFLTAFKERYSVWTGAYAGWGLENFRDIFADRNFMGAIRNTFVYAFLVVPISTCIAIVIATLLNQKIKFRGLFQTAFFLPMVTSALAIGLAWRWLFHHRFGFFNYILSFFGVDPINWLQAHGMVVIVVFGIWNILPFTIILLLSGLQNIDPLYYTAAKADGAKTLRTFFRITVPLLAPTIGLVLIVNMISSFRVFGELFPFFAGQPGFAGSLWTMVFYIFDMFFVRSRFGHAAAAALILFLITFVLTLIQLFIQRKWRY